MANSSLQPTSGRWAIHNSAGVITKVVSVSSYWGDLDALLNSHVDSGGGYIKLNNTANGVASNAHRWVVRNGGVTMKTPLTLSTSGTTILASEKVSVAVFVGGTKVQLTDGLGTYQPAVDQGLTKVPAGLRFQVDPHDPDYYSDITQTKGD